MHLSVHFVFKKTYNKTNAFNSKYILLYIRIELEYIPKQIFINYLHVSIKTICLGPML